MHRAAALEQVDGDVEVDILHGGEQDGVGLVVAGPIEHGDAPGEDVQPFVLPRMLELFDLWEHASSLGTRALTGVPQLARRGAALVVIR